MTSRVSMTYVEHRHADDEGFATRSYEDGTTVVVEYDDDGNVIWTDNQRCPHCNTAPTSCHWCEPCGIELCCASSEYGLARATVQWEWGIPVLVLGEGRGPLLGGTF